MTIFSKYFFLRTKLLLNIRTLLSEYFDFFYFYFDKRFLEVFSSETFWIIRCVELEHKRVVILNLKTFISSSNQLLQNIFWTFLLVLHESWNRLIHVWNISWTLLLNTFSLSLSVRRFPSWLVDPEKLPSQQNFTGLQCHTPTDPEGPVHTTQSTYTHWTEPGAERT